MPKHAWYFINKDDEVMMCTLNEEYKILNSAVKSHAQEENKLRHHHVISTSVLFSNIALDQSAGEKSLRNGKNNIFNE